MKVILYKFFAKVKFFIFIIPFFLNNIAYSYSNACIKDSKVIKAITYKVQESCNINLNINLLKTSLRKEINYEKNSINKFIYTIYSSKIYNHVKVKIIPLINNYVHVILVAYPSYTVKTIKFLGNYKLCKSKLQNLIIIKNRNFLSKNLIKKNINRIIRYYRKNRFFKIKIYPIIKNNLLKNTTVILLKIHEGNQINSSNFFSKKRYLSINSFQNNQDLVNFYENYEFFDVKIYQSQLIIDFLKQKKIYSILYVDKGNQYCISDVNIKGNQLYSNKILKKIIGFQLEDIYYFKKIKKGISNIRDYYKNSGYFNLAIYTKYKYNIKKNNIYILYNILENDILYLEEINTIGNIKTDNKTILRESTLEPGDLLNLIKVKTSNIALKDLSFFKKLYINLEEKSNFGFIKKQINIKEKNTGNFTFGIGLSSLEKSFIFKEFTQNNFDLFNYCKNFQGKGQKFKVYYQITKRSNEILMSFTEPWFCKKKLEFGCEAYRFINQYKNFLYHELHYGFSVFLCKSLSKVIRGNLRYELQYINFSKIKDKAPDFIKKIRKKNFISKLIFEIIRDTRNNLITPSKGSLSKIILELSGGPIRGSIDFLRLEFQLAKWWSIFRSNQQIFALITKIGAISSYNKQEIPILERYFLGGPKNMRGFKYHLVGPKNLLTKGIIGGNTFTFATIEYSFNTLKNSRLLIFYNFGCINSLDLNWNLNNYNDSLGIGLILQFKSSPLRIDLGFPVKSDNCNNYGLKLNFSFGNII